jgi:hypothetical protein
MKIYSGLGFLENERKNICSHFDEGKEENFNLHNLVSLQLLESNITQTGGTGPVVVIWVTSARAILPLKCGTAEAISPANIPTRMEAEGHFSFGSQVQSPMK